MLNKNDILSANDLPSEVVSVPEWGGDVTVRTMSGSERDSFEAEILAGGKMQTDNVRARLLVRVLVDADGERLFSDGDAAALGRKSASVLTRLFEVAQRLNRLTAADVEELAKN